MQYHSLDGRFGQTDRAAHLTRAAWTLYRRGRLESALSKVREARDLSPEPFVVSSLERLERLAKRQLDGFIFRIRGIGE